MKKLTNSEGKVAVVLATGFGNRWYTNHFIEELLFDYELSTLVLRITDDNRYEVAAVIEDYCSEKYPDFTFIGDTTDLVVTWLDKGTKFRIDNVDGHEVLVLKKMSDGNLFWKEA